MKILGNRVRKMKTPEQQYAASGHYETVAAATARRKKARDARTRRQQAQDTGTDDEGED